MKKFLQALPLVLLFLIACQQEESLKVISFNIRLDSPNDGENRWGYRKAEMVDFLKNQEADIFGLQEAMYHQRMYIDSVLESYVQIGVGRDDGKNKGEATPIFYKTASFKLIQQSTIWLSETPDIPGKGWDAAYPRLCTMALFWNKEVKTKLWVLNTHFDHKGEEARAKSAQMLMDTLEVLNPKKYPVIFMGDLNAEPASFPISIIDSKLSGSQGEYHKTGTFNGFKRDTIMDRTIDYIFSYGFDSSTCAYYPAKRKNGLWLSDHLPIIATFRY